MVLRKVNIIIGVLVIGMLISTLYSSYAHAEGLNGITNTVTEVVEPNKTDPIISEELEGKSNGESSGAEVIGNLFKNIGVDSQSAEKANQYLQPFARGANMIFALLLSIASIAMFLITALDLLYIAIPPIRNVLYLEGQQSMMQGTSGMGGQGALQETQSKPKLVSRLISDEAVAAVANLGGAIQPQSQGMPGIGGMQQQEPQKMKSVLFDYLKKRSFFLVTFGLCAVLLSTTIFTDLGVKIGFWIMNRLMGIESSIPE